MSTGNCLHCGADRSIHQYETELCPAGGIEQEGAGRYGPKCFQEIQPGIEVNGPANIIMVINGYLHEAKPKEPAPESVDTLLAIVKLEAEKTTRYMTAYANAVRHGQRPPKWHEV